ncbi:SurA N-terminal domain-containing protein [bacterium]|nr:SurA N-terminal domain-containing protein [bacterium]
MTDSNLIIRKQDLSASPANRTTSMTRLFLIITFLIILVATLALVFIMKNRLLPPMMDNPIIATVGQKTIKLDEFLLRYRVLYAKQWEMLTRYEREQLALDLINRMITMEILLEEAKKNGLTNDSNLNSTIDALTELCFPHSKHHNISDDYFTSQINVQGKMKENMLARKVKESILFQEPVSVTEAEIQAYYTYHQNKYLNDTSQIHLRQILFDHVQTGKRIFSELKKGTTIETVMEKFIDAGAETPELIDLGFVQLNDIEPDEQKLVLATADNDYVSYTSSEGDYLVLHVVEKRMKGIIPLGKVHDDIKAIILHEKQDQIFTTWLEQQYNQLPVTLSEQRLLKNLTTDKVLFGLENEHKTGY